MPRLKLQPSGATLWKLLLSAACLLVLSLNVGCTTTPEPVYQGCVCQSTDMLTEIAKGELDWCAPATAAWEREWHRECGVICDGR
jgi:hypothetical protein